MDNTIPKEIAELLKKFAEQGVIIRKTVEIDFSKSLEEVCKARGIDMNDTS